MTMTTTTTTPLSPPCCHHRAYKNDGRCPPVTKNPEGTGGGGGGSVGMGAAEGGVVLVKSIFCVLVLKRNSACVWKIIADILFYVTDIPNSTCTITESDKRCPREHLLEEILKGLRVWAAGLNLFIVSISNLVSCFSTRCTWWLNNNGTKLCVITDIFGTAYLFIGEYSIYWVFAQIKTTWTLTLFI
jgi:hypothetical protein